MKTATSFCLLAVAAMLSGHAHALYKCTTKEGVVYQDRPCATGTETVVQFVTTSLGESPQTPIRYARTKVDATIDDSSLAAVPVSVVVKLPPKN